ncbi:MAG: AraC family transcriptional regulator ligand-binding domain-containing protein [Candidatus Krumholzibacteria bacterium]|nr:AraC family transcriptional regulator ligand-binding domain-containing protein [Candidatus Krumholzibacteria bacterium]
MEAIRRGGVDTYRLSRDHPNEIRNLLADPGALPPDELNFILNLCAELSGDDNFGLHLVDLVDPTMFGPLGYLLANAPTFDRLLYFTEMYYHTLYRSAVFELNKGETVCSLEFRVQGSPQVSLRHLNEWPLGFFAVYFARQIGHGWLPLRVEFTNEAPDDVRELERVFGSNITFNAPRTAFEFEREILDRKINTSDSRFLKILTDQAEALLLEVVRPESFETGVRLQILELLESGGANSRDIARNMAMSRSTLKRELAARSLTFRGLRNEIIKEVACKALLETDTEVGALARKLGYSELSAFDRAFKRITGMNPTMFKRAQQKSDVTFQVSAPDPPLKTRR